MKTKVLVLLLALPLVGCAGLERLAPGIGAGAALITAGISLASHNANQKEVQAAAPFRRAEMENLCVGQLRGSVDSWPQSCAQTTLTRMDACGRAGFESPLCMQYAQQYAARIQSEEAKQQQVSIQKGTPSNAKKVSAVQKTASKPPVKKVVAKKKKKTKPEVIKVKS